MNHLFTGACTAIVTPFTDNGVDYEAFKRLIDFQIENGISALLGLGTTGEASTMPEDERKTVMEFFVKYINKRVPVLLGVGSNCTNGTIKMAKFAEQCGADQLLVVTPYYNKCTQKGLVAHFTAVADAVNTPIMLYNVPTRTGVNIAPQTALQLSNHKNIVAIKEASGNIAQMMELARLTSDKLSIYSGDDGLIYPMITIGGVGVVSVISNVAPRMTSELCAHALNGDYIAARELQFKLSPLVTAIFSEVNPIPVKAGLAAMGLIPAKLRLPLTDIEDSNLAILKKEMKEIGLI